MLSVLFNLLPLQKNKPYSPSQTSQNTMKHVGNHTITSLISWVICDFEISDVNKSTVDCFIYVHCFYFTMRQGKTIHCDLLSVLGKSVSSSVSLPLSSSSSCENNWICCIRQQQQQKTLRFFPFQTNYIISHYTVGVFCSTKSFHFVFSWKNRCILIRDLQKYSLHVECANDLFRFLAKR